MRLLSALQYTDTSFTPPPYKRLSEKEYGQVLNSCVLACVDVFVHFQGKVLMGERAQRPARNLLWIMGGRMIPGELYAQSAARILKREAGLDVSALDRFKLFAINGYRWAEREQIPLVDGCHMIGFNMALKIRKNELQSLTRRSDFLRFHLVNIHDLAAGNTPQPTHQAMIDLAKKFLNKHSS